MNLVGNLRGIFILINFCLKAFVFSRRVWKGCGVSETTHVYNGHKHISLVSTITYIDGCILLMVHAYIMNQHITSQYRNRRSQIADEFTLNLLSNQPIEATHQFRCKILAFNVIIWKWRYLHKFILPSSSKSNL